MRKLFGNTLRRLLFFFERKVQKKEDSKGDHGNDRGYPDLEADCDKESFQSGIKKLKMRSPFPGKKDCSAENSHGERNADRICINERDKYIQQGIQKTQETKKHAFSRTVKLPYRENAEKDAKVHCQGIEKKCFCPVGNKAEETEEFKEIA